MRVPNNPQAVELREAESKMTINDASQQADQSNRSQLSVLRK